MLQLYELKRLLTRIAISTTAISTALYYFFQLYMAPEWPVYRIVTLASFVASALVGVSLSAPVSRRIWKLLRKLDREVYPDLSGTWSGLICPYQSKATPGAAESFPIRAVVRHSPLAIQMDFHGDAFDSITLVANPTIEQGHHNLYYIYRAVPKTPGRDAYLGTAILRIELCMIDGLQVLSMSGNYYTTRQTIGTIELWQGNAALGGNKIPSGGAPEMSPAPKP